MKYKRICIYPKDVQLITGKSERYGRKLLKRIKNELNKDDHHFITVNEFCAFTGLPTDQVNESLIS